jgi:ABC-type oligopeptide transport system substrate-binding subunit/class 3 adenylate cyclase/type II secretory pathway predicted ATPase ExeA
MRQSAPAALQERLRSASAEIEGERKPVTILFTDIVGSTGLAEQLDPEEWKEIVSGAHRRVSQAVYRYEGIVAQLLGDGVLAFFGAPITHEDDPERAVRAGLDIQAAIRAYARDLAGLVDSFEMRVGIHSGTVVVGQVGDDLHMEYLAVGDAVNLAARLQSAARPGQVLLSEATGRLVRGAFELADAGALELKGKSAPVHAYEALTARTPAVSLRSGSRQATPLVGRLAELGQLNAALGQLQAGSGHIVAVLGEAGIGKSRLVDDARLALTAHEASLRWLEGRSLSYGQALSFWTITQLLQADLELADGDPAPRVRAALRRRVGELFGDQADQVLPYLAHLLGVRLDGPEADRAVALDGETLKRQVLWSLGRYFEQAARAQPLVLVCEDLHWADPSSLDALEQLLALTDRAPLVLILLARPERDAGAWRLKLRAETDYPHRFTEIDLEPLSASEQDQLVNHLLPVAELPPEMHQLILARSEGNPFYLEEVVHSLQEQGALVEVDGRWQATPVLQRVEIPETLQGLLLARLDRLADDVRRTLQLAAVIGKSFPYRLLEAISKAERQLDTHLAQLQRVDLVREKSRRPELEYIFKHALTQEAAYQSLLLERRREFHRRVASALEGMFADRRDEYFGLLAYHYEAAGEAAQAIDYLLRAGDQARVGDALPEARDYYQRAVALQQAVPDYAGAARTWLKLGLVYQAEFAFEQAHRAYETAFALKRLAPAQGEAPSFRRAGPPHTLRLCAYIEQRHLSTSEIVWNIDLDPGRATYTEDADMANALFAGLAEIDLETNVVPHAARSWEVLDDGRRYVFHLRDDVRWSDGQPATAHDFEFAWKRNLAPSRPAYPAVMLDDVQGASDYRLGRNPDPNSVGVRALDDLTLEVILRAPVAYFTYIVALPVAFPQPRHVVERVGDGWWRPPQAVFSGAYRAVELRPDGWVLERNGFYFGEIPGNIERLQYAELADSGLAVAGFMEGRFDLCFRVPRKLVPSDLLAASQVEEAEVSFHVWFINRQLPPLDDVRVRQALAHGLDSVRHFEDVFGVRPNAPRGGLIPPALAGHSPELGLPFDLLRARALLAEAGYPGGQGLPALRFGFFGNAPGFEPAQRQLWEDLGIRIEPDRLPTDAAPAPAAKCHLLFQGWVADYPDPDALLRASAIYYEALQPGWAPPDYLRLLEEAARTADRQRRMALYRRADRLAVNEMVVVIPHAVSPPFVTLSRPRLTGFEPNALGSLAYKNLRLEPGQPE